MQYYELVIAKDGPKLKEAADDPAVRATIGSATMARTGTQRVVGKGQTVEALADNLSKPSFGPVLNKTGLTKKYDFELEYAASDETVARLRQQGMYTADGPPPFPDLPAAIQQQLGLRLVPVKGPIEILVVDHCEKQPTEN